MLISYSDYWCINLHAQWYDEFQLLAYCTTVICPELFKAVSWFEFVNVLVKLDSVQLSL